MQKNWKFIGEISAPSPRGLSAIADWGSNSLRHFLTKMPPPSKREGTIIATQFLNFALCALHFAFENIPTNSILTMCFYKRYYPCFSIFNQSHLDTMSIFV